MRPTYTFDEKYRAMLSKDPSFEGIFITAVKTTGIFCRPICTAKKPKPENVVFYNSTDEAIKNGYRPCAVCKPLELRSKTPEHIEELIHELTSNPELRLKDEDLRERGLEPNQLRRWFKKNHNMSFQAYQRMLRINRGYQKLATGEKVTSAAFDVGYNSLSGFSERIQFVFGDKPSQVENKTVILIKRITTPLGPMFACATPQGLCLLEFTDRRILEIEFKDLCKRLDAVILPGENSHLTQTEQEVTEYFSGKRKQFSVALHTPGTAFQQSAWRKLREIPFGKTASYQEQANMLGLPGAVRAVGTANGANRIAIIIPCHRVISSNGTLAGYGGGLPRKQWLIDFEKRHSQTKHNAL